MIVFSHCDGISCGQVAVERSGFLLSKYYATEIEPKSIQIAVKNYPKTVQLGDMTYVDYAGLPKVDLYMGGTPCENLSITAVDRPDVATGLRGSKSSLFWEFVKGLYALKPAWFLLENVASMRNESRDIITRELGVTPIMIDSALVSAQDRKRYYWTNIPQVSLPLDKGFVLKDIMENSVSEHYYYDKPFEFYGLDKKVVGRLLVNSHDLVRRVYNPDFKCATLTAINGGYQEKKVWDNGRVRKLTPVEYERLQTLPDNYTEGVSENVRRSMCGDGWTVDVVAHILRHIKK